MHGSPDDLVATAVADQLREQRETYWDRPGARVEHLADEVLERGIENALALLQRG